jgi:FkbM family methyltransferase
MRSRTIREAIERATQSLVYWRRLPAEFHRAPLLVSPSAGLKYLFKRMNSIDPPLLRNARELVRSGDIVWDIGANIGLFTFAAASMAGSKGAVVAFEPDTWLISLLARSRRAQPEQSGAVTIVPAAVASDISLRRFRLASRSRASNALSGYGHSQIGTVREECTVPTFNLDWLLETLPMPRIIKCDVEGAEVEVFRDQHKMLTEVRPIIICEVCGEAEAEIARVLTGADYRLFDGEKSIVGQVERKQASWSTLAIPAEQSASYTAT